MISRDVLKICVYNPLASGLYGVRAFFAALGPRYRDICIRLKIHADIKLPQADMQEQETDNQFSKLRGSLTAFCRYIRNNSYG
jgi:hypothetical protein